MCERERVVERQCVCACVCVRVCVRAQAHLLHHFSKEKRFSVSIRFSGCLSENVSGSIVTLLFVTSWTIDRQVPLSMEFSRHEYWTG